jgi:PIN domain nuclease of toxin-antitoxin system
VGQRLLLDTHVLIWWRASDRPAISTAAYDAIADPASEVFVSVASVWEIAIKRALGKLHAPGSLTQAIGAVGFRELPIAALHAEQAGGLPLHHTDPFDRMLVAQAQAEGLTVVTRDANIPRYGIRTLMA